jgi:predicted aspartyl protease
MMRSLVAFLLIACPSAAPTQRQPVRVPAEIRGSRVLLPVSVNGGPPATFILDTGAGSTTIDRDYAEKRGVHPTGEALALGAAGRVNVGLARDVSFSFGGLTLPGGRTPLIPLGAISLRAGNPMQGVLGYEAFKEHVVEIDYVGGSVSFHETRAFRRPAGAERIPIAFRHDVPRVEARLTLADGRTIPARLFVDTGADTGIVLTRAFTDKHAIEVEHGFETSAGLGVGGASRERVGRIPRLELGPFAIHRPIVSLSYSTDGLLGDSRVDGLLGGEILKRFTLTIDYDRKQLLLKRNRNFGTAMEFDMSGLTVASRDAAFDAVVVDDVRPSSPAADAGIRAGDELRAIDGQRVLPARLDVIRAMFKEAGRRLELTIVRDGEERTVAVVLRRMT